MSRGYNLSDFDRLLRKYSDSPLPHRLREKDRVEVSRGAGGSSEADRLREQPQASTENTSECFRTLYRDRNREYSLRQSEIQTLVDLGKFRVIPPDDLAELAYRGDRSRMENDLHNLRRQGLIEQRSIEGHGSYSTRVLTLTKQGHKFVCRGNFVPENQALYHGFVKPREARHDADLYRLYHQVAGEIERSGGKIRRVILDYELTKDLYRALSRVPPDKDLSYERVHIATQHHLKVVDDKIPVPDLRIEYLDTYRERASLDLEIATRDYRPQGLAEKARAGFHLFARQQDHPRLRRILNDQEITARIFSL